MADDAEKSAAPEAAGGDEPGELVPVQTKSAVDAEEGEIHHLHKRETWGSKVAYLLTLVGYAVGFGNLWRFPFMMRENGGLAFLIPYCVMLTFVGIPVFFLEIAVGQRRRKGIIYTWQDVNPHLGGMGMCCMCMSFLIGIYYNTYLGTCMSYFIDSLLYDPLPWANCSQVSSNLTERLECHQKLGDRATKYYYYNGVLGQSEGLHQIGNYNWGFAGFVLAGFTIVWVILLKGTTSVGYTAYFTAVFPYLVLTIFFIGNFCVNDMEKANVGAWRLLRPKWEVLQTPVTWLRAGSQIFFSLGVAFGTLVIFSSQIPPTNNCYRDAISISLINCSTSLYAALVIFPFIGAYGFRQWEDCVTRAKDAVLDTALWNEIGSNRYDIYFTTLDSSSRNTRGPWSTVTKVEVRYGYGENAGKMASEFPADFKMKAVTTLASRPGLLVEHVVRNCSIGELATESGGGPGFVFMAFTEAVLNLPGSNVWAILFFAMLFTLGIDSGFGTVECVVGAFEDLTGYSRMASATIVCWVSTILALLLFPFGHGAYVSDLLDQWCANWTLLLIGLSECIGVAWVYGLAQMSYDIKLMTGNKPNIYILLCWKYITPAIITAMLLGSIIMYIMNNLDGIKYDAWNPDEAYKSGDLSGITQVNYPWYSLTAGVILMILCMIWFPLQAVLHKTKYTLVKPTGPSEFPEEELRKTRNIDVEKEEDQFTTAEKKVIGNRSLQDLQQHQDEMVRSQSKTKVLK